MQGSCQVPRSNIMNWTMAFFTSNGSFVYSFLHERNEISEYYFESDTLVIFVFWKYLSYVPHNSLRLDSTLDY